MRKNEYILFLLPALIGFGVFFYWPLVQNLYLSFFQWNMISPQMIFVGLQNYRDMVVAQDFAKILLNTAFYLILLLGANFLLPYLYSYILAYLVERGGYFYRTALFLPSTISLTVGSILFLWIFNPLAGPIAVVLQMLGLSAPVWFKTSGLVIVAISVIVGWKVFGYNLLIMLSAMISVPADVIEAAKLEGASNSQIFRHIIIPMTSSTALYVLTVTIVFGLQYVLVPINMITQGGPDQYSSNLVYVVYQYAFTFFKTGQAAAWAIFSMVVYGGLLVLKYKILDKKVYYEN